MSLLREENKIDSYKEIVDKTIADKNASDRELEEKKVELRKVQSELREKFESLKADVDLFLAEEGIYEYFAIRADEFKENFKKQEDGIWKTINKNPYLFSETKDKILEIYEKRICEKIGAKIEKDTGVHFDFSDSRPLSSFSYDHYLKISDEESIRLFSLRSPNTTSEPLRNFYVNENTNFRNDVELLPHYKAINDALGKFLESSYEDVKADLIQPLIEGVESLVDLSKDKRFFKTPLDMRISLAYLKMSKAIG